MSRIALFQATSGIDPAANAARAGRRRSRQAAKGGAAMLFTPEMSGLLDQDRARTAGAVTSEADDGVLAAVREAAAKAGHLGPSRLARGARRGAATNTPTAAS